MSRVIKPQEAAAKAQVSTATILRWVNGPEEFPGFKLGSVWRFDEDEVDAWIEAQRGVRS